MYEVYLVYERNGQITSLDFLHSHSTLQLALDDIRETWLEGSDDPDLTECYIIMHKKRIVAALNHAEHNWNECVTTYTAEKKIGETERHLIEYVLDQNGGYVSTQIHDLPPIPTPPSGWQSIDTTVPTETW